VNTSRMPGAPTKGHLVKGLMSERRITYAFRAGFGGKADADAHNLRPACGNRVTRLAGSPLFRQLSLIDEGKDS
jgi:hypothetical protein